MKFKFNIKLNDKDYLDYNVFWMMKSHYGKRQWIKLRLFLILPFAIISLLPLISKEYSPQNVIIPSIIILALVQVLLKPIYIWTLKTHIKTLKKSGKMGYSPISDIEFYEESFIEITADNKTEQKYSAIERVSVITNMVIYIHVNNLMSYILPFHCFESKEQLNVFLDFIKTKCVDIDIY